MAQHSQRGYHEGEETLAAPGGARCRLTSQGIKGKVLLLTLVQDSQRRYQGAVKVLEEDRSAVHGVNRNVFSAMKWGM